MYVPADLSTRFDVSWAVGSPGVLLRRVCCEIDRALPPGASSSGTTDDEILHVPMPARLGKEHYDAFSISPHLGVGCLQWQLCAAPIRGRWHTESPPRRSHSGS